MTTSFNTLPADVQDALVRGRKEDAARLLRQARGISLKGAQAQIAAVVSQGLPATPIRTEPTRIPHHAIGDAGLSQPPDLGAAASRMLARLRAAIEQRGHQEPQAQLKVDPESSSLAPGEQARSKLSNFFTLALVVAAVLVLVDPGSAYALALTLAAGAVLLLMPH